MQSAKTAAHTTCPHCDTASEGWSICPRCARNTTISGKFRMGAELDRGGVARIHAAHGEGEDETEAVVKVMEHTPLNSRQVHELFARSARLLTGLSHAGVPRVLGFDRTPKRSFLVMERFAGGTLYEHVKRSGPLRAAALDRLLRGLLETVAYLHAHALIHGDVTPRNVMFRSRLDDRPVLVDFDGLCHTNEHALASLVMTPGYSAPEQKAGEMTTAADLYGVGATVVFAATGQSPDRLHRRGRALELDLDGADLSATTRELLQRLVAIAPAKRPTSARQALGSMELVSAVAGASASASARRRPARAVLAVVMLMLVCVLAGCAFALARGTTRGAAHQSSSTS